MQKGRRSLVRLPAAVIGRGMRRDAPALRAQQQLAEPGPAGQGAPFAGAAPALAWCLRPGLPAAGLPVDTLLATGVIVWHCPVLQPAIGLGMALHRCEALSCKVVVHRHVTRFAICLQRNPNPSRGGRDSSQRMSSTGTV